MDPGTRLGEREHVPSVIESLGLFEVRGSGAAYLMLLWSDGCSVEEGRRGGRRGEAGECVGVVSGGLGGGCRGPGYVCS